MSLLRVITALSHEFGTVDYVRGGGGNTSAKDADTLWVKPSGTTLAGLFPDMFVTMDREKLTELYAIETPKEPAATSKHRRVLNRITANTNLLLDMESRCKPGPQTHCRNWPERPLVGDLPPRLDPPPAIR